MFLKDYLKDIYQKASFDKNHLIVENIINRWAHRFGIESLNDLLIHDLALREYRHEKENQEQITLIDENHEKENQEQITLIDENHEKENQ